MGHIEMNFWVRFKDFYSMACLDSRKDILFYLAGSTCGKYCQYILSINSGLLLIAGKVTRKQ